ncbi:MAG: hypothetical protein ACI8PT_001773, partial [Gammaproteobacteria bacterium]
APSLMARKTNDFEANMTRHITPSHPMVNCPVDSFVFVRIF